jgi:ferredoxin-type protein NapF
VLGVILINNDINHERRGLFGSLFSKASEVVKEVSSNINAEVPKEVRKQEEPVIIRPPYYDLNQEESLFHQVCQYCTGICATVCEEDIIKISEDKTPYLDFSKSGCTFCDKCAVVCSEQELFDEENIAIEKNVLNVVYISNVNVSIMIENESCLAWDKVMCFSCKEPCLENAITFEGLFKPVIDESKCTSCGFCISRCPTEAIKIGNTVSVEESEQDILK